MVIQTNISALRTYRLRTKATSAMTKNLEKLSSGYRINRSADDASGLAVSERMRANITELDRCHSNAQEGLNLAKTADGALAEISDMLRRARELCIQAENGTYSQQERSAISDEMNQLFSEIDRITAASTFHELRLFRGDAGPDFHYEYDEGFLPVDPAQGTALWGSIDFVETGSFDTATEAKSATATFHLNGIKAPKDLDGKTLTINGKTYYFYDGTTKGFQNRPPGSVALNWSSYSSVSSILSYYLPSRDSNVESLSISGDTVTLTAPRRDINDTCFIDGEDVLLRVEKGEGEWANGISVTSGGGSLGEVDPAANDPAYGKLTGTFSLTNVPDLPGGLSSDDVDSLKKNTLHVYGMSIPLKGGNFTIGMGRDAVGQEVAQLIDAKFKAEHYVNYSVQYDATSDDLTISFEDKTGSASTLAHATIYESRDYTSTPANYGNTVSASALGISVDVKMSEKNEVTEITIPDNLSGPFGLKIGDNYYLYHDSTIDPLRDDDHTFLTNCSPATPSVIDLSIFLSKNDILEDISLKIQRYAETAGGTVKVEQNKIIVTDPAANHSLNLKSSISGAAVSATAYRPGASIPQSAFVLGGSTGHIGQSNFSGYFQQETTVSFTVDGSNLSSLAGKGFNLDGFQLAFVNKGEPASVPDGYTKFELSGLADMNALTTELQNSMDRYTVTFDPVASKMVFTWYRTANGSQNQNGATVTDGYKGSIMTEPDGVKFQGGVNTGHSQKRIDFSSITAENMDDLLGKGFRINCASCEGEFINILFCREKGNMPECFDIKIDPATGKRLPNNTTDPNAKTVTIRNYAVELSKVSSPQQIVNSIVQQLSGQLGHFTTVEQDPDNPLVLLAQDKRYGVITHPVTQTPTLGAVEGGIEANFTYSINIRKVEDYPADGSVDLKHAEVEIYVGSEPDPQIIPIHLPYLDLKTLRLSPPEVVDLNASDQSASNWLSRVDKASLAISKARSAIGADYNRLEHTIQSLSHAQENLTDAESRIRDTDMAEEMMEHVKLQILTQSQQSMLSQAMAQPRQVLRLIS